MSFLQGILLGLMQGVAEFLPVSSSGHLLVLRNIMGLEDVPLLFDILLHIATLAVVIFVFRKMIGSLIVSLYRWIIRKPIEEDKKNMFYIIWILVATFITGVIGVIYKKSGFEGNLTIAGICFIVTGLLLVAVSFIQDNSDSNKKLLDNKNTGDITWKSALACGLFQGLGTLPGISRSGSTLAGALFTGVNRKKAVEFSFILSIPAILGALILDLKDAGDLASSVSVPVLLAALISATVAGFFSIILLKKLVNQGKLYFFSIYLIPLGVVVLLFLR